MLTISQCRKILSENGGGNYTDEQIEKIREFLYKFAALELEMYKQRLFENKPDVKPVNLTSDSL